MDYLYIQYKDLRNLYLMQTILNIPETIVDKYFEILKIIFPIWVMTPDVVSSVIPLRSGIFDKVIFDEIEYNFRRK